MTHAGTPDAASARKGPLSYLGLLVGGAFPAGVLLWGLAALGADAISWAGAMVWGLASTAAFTLVAVAGKKIGMTRLDIRDLLGSMVAPPGTASAQVLGTVVHHVGGVIIAVAWAYGVALADLPANWLTGLAWGVVLTVVALIILSSIGVMHPRMRTGELEDPGPGATNFGAMTPLASLIEHLVYGLVLGLGYGLLPLG